MFEYLCFNVWVFVFWYFKNLCLCVHSPFYSLYLCLSSSSVSIEGLIPLMRGLRGLLVVQTFNAHLFARFSFRTHLFGFPFSLAVGHTKPPACIICQYIRSLYNVSLFYLCCICAVQPKSEYLWGYCSRFGWHVGAACSDSTLSQKTLPSPFSIPLRVLPLLLTALHFS